ncbi:hypothetical protein BDV3_004781 [Batrachochytrium dendrobatidis]
MFESTNIHGTIIEDNECWALFQKWLVLNNCSISSLVLAHFSDTGRGLMATSDFQIGDPVVCIPARLLLVPRRTHKLFNNHPAIVALKQHPSIALFIAWQKIHPTPEWSPYIDILPRSFDTMPLCIDLKLLAMLPYDIQEIAKNQQSKLDTDYAFVCTALAVSGYEMIPKDIFKWAWIVVNTRCITMNTNAISKPQLSHIHQQPIITLAPFLDCLNHTSTARISAGYDTVEKAYIIRTLVPYKKGSQVFINYGPHDNNFLLAEYGFAILKNPFNHVVLDREVDFMMQHFGTVSDLLKSEGLYGEFIIANDDLGYRLMNAMRLYVAVSQGSDLSSVLPAWRSVLGGTLQYISKDLEKATLQQLIRICVDKLNWFQQSLVTMDAAEYEEFKFATVFTRQIVNEAVEILQEAIELATDNIASI